MVKSKATQLFLLVMLMAFSFGCRKTAMNPIDFVKWVETEENGLRITKTFGQMELSVQYKPIDYIVAKEERDPMLKLETLNSRKMKLEGLQYYNIRYSIRDRSEDIIKYKLVSESEYYERMNYFSFGFQNDIYLVQGKDTLECKLFNYARSYGLSPTADFALAFEIPSNNRAEDRQLIINDNVYGVGTVKFHFSESDMKSLPSIRTY